MRPDVRRAVRHLRAVEPKFAPVIERAPPCDLAPKAEFEVFPALVGAIVSQQLSGKAAETIYGRIPGLFGTPGLPSPGRVLATPSGFLRTAGVSGAKEAAIRDLAAKVLDGTVPAARDLHVLPDDEIVARLTRVRGIGRWTVEMLLIFDLGRPDVFPVDDLGVRKGFQRLFRRPGARRAEMERRAERWRPHRSVASWYLWRATDGKAG